MRTAAWSQRLVLSAFFVLLVSGCSQRDLGRYCFVGAEGGSNSNTGDITILNPEAPECGERLCLRQGGYKCLNDLTSCPTPADQAALRSMCTIECETNKDCKETDENVNGCSKYVCQRQGEMSGFPNRCICVCLDYIRDTAGASISESEFNSDPDYSSCSQE